MHFMLATTVAAAAAAMVLPASALATPAYQWSGVYVGVQAQYGMGNYQEHDLTDSSRYGYQSQSPSAGAFAGYNHLFGGNWLAGVEVEGNWDALVSHYYDSDYTGGPLFTHDWSAAARLRFGFLASPATLFYGSVGIAAGNIDLSKGYWAYYNNPDYGDSSPDSTVAGLQLAAGLESFVSQRVSVRAEGIFTHYGTGLVTMFGEPNTETHLNTLAARFGIVYHTGLLGQPPAETALPPVGRSWSGLYVGAQAGAIIFGSQEDNDPAYAAPYDPAVSFGATGVDAGGYAGFNWEFGSSIVAGIEAGGMMIDAPVHEYSNSTFETHSWQASVRARLGFVTASRTLFYGTVGVAGGGFDYSSGYPSATGFSRTAFTATGLQLGAGVEAFLTPKLSARMEGIYTDYGSHQIFRYGAPNWMVDPRTFEARLGLALHLN